eukprot:tig00021127_g18750.t1
MDLGLKDVHVLITGASGGIGIETAHAFLAQGAKVSAHYNTQIGELGALEERYGPGRVYAVKADVRSEAEVQQALDAASAKLGPVQVLVLNHGIFPATDVLLKDMSLEQWQRTLDVNLTGCFLFARAFMRQVTGEMSNVAVVLIGSTSGLFGEVGHADYSSTKAALHNGFMRTLKNEIYHVNPRGRVNTVAPGWVLTKMAEEAVGRDPGVLDRACCTIAMRKVAAPADVANAVLFLASGRAAGHVSGTVLEVTGGMEGRLLHPPAAPS